MRATAYPTSVNRDRRKVLAGIFADAAKYTLTAGVIGSILSEKFGLALGGVLGLAFGVLATLAYVVTPPDKE